MAQSLLDKFSTPVEVDPPAATVQREDLADGTLVMFLGSKRITPENGGRAFVEHTFTAHDGERRFKVYGSSQLNTKLHKVRPGARVYLRYLGQSEDENREHRWDVRALNASHQQMTALREEMRQPLEKFSATLNTRWEEYHARMAELVSRRHGNTPPPHSDEDAPPF